MSEAKISHIILVICAVSIIGTGLWSIKDGLFYAAAPALIAVLWELRLVTRQFLVRTRIVICALMTLLAVILNLGFVSKGEWRVAVIAALFVGILILALRDFLPRRFGALSGRSSQR